VKKTIFLLRKMKAVILPVIVYVAALCITSGCNAFMKDHGLTLYISPSGSDSWSGKLATPSDNKTDGPLATLEGARDAVRKLRHDGSLTRESVRIVLEAGTYELSGTFSLDSIDSGADSLSPVVFAAARGAEVRITGGRLIKGWQQVSDKSVLNQFRPEVRSFIMQAVADPSGVPDFGSPHGGGAELFFNDQPMHVSRYPNKGYMKIAGLLNLDPVDIRGTKGDKSGKFIYDDGRISKWVAEKDPWVHGYWFWDWSEERHKIAQIDTVKKILEVLPPYHNYGYRTGQWFYGFNLLCEIDEPGEYYVDRSAGIIYFYPPSDISKGKSYISSIQTLIDLNGVSNVSFDGLIFEGCRSTAVRIRNSENVSVIASTIRNTGDAAVEIKGGRKNGVTGCDIYNAGGAGITIEAGDRHTLEPGSCYADNNFIHNIARLKRVYNPGITISGAGNRISHNLIRVVPHMAIGFLGNDHVIEYNEIDSACYESNDAGAIYTGRNWTMRGNLIRFNYLHNISGFEGKGCVGIYLDDAFSSAEIYGNIFKNVTRAMMIGGGRDNKVINNIFVDCVPSMHVDARGLGWMRNEHIPGWIKEAEDSGTILGIAYNKPPYSVRYPELMNILQDEPRAPKGNIISNNICYGGVWDKASGFWHVAIEDKARPYLKMENNVVSPGSQVEDSLSKSILIADPCFVERSDPEKGKFKLADGSPAFRTGFIQIPFEKIGLYQDKNRASWPVK
jgi:hypothetical protein